MERLGIDNSRPLATGGRAGYTLTWPGPVDTVTMSADHRRVSGANQYGFPVSGTEQQCVETENVAHHFRCTYKRSCPPR